MDDRPKGRPAARLRLRVAAVRDFRSTRADAGLRHGDGPANELIRCAIKSQDDDSRMPAILADDAWSTWLGEGDATPATAKAVLRTMEGVNWQAAPEPKKPRPRKP